MNEEAVNMTPFYVLCLIFCYPMKSTTRPVSGPGQIQFVKRTVFIQEDIGVYSAQVERAYGVAGNVSAEFGTYEATASFYWDYRPTKFPFELKWNDGESGVKNFTVYIFNDKIYEGTEYFEAKIITVYGCATRGPIQNVFITANDNVMFAQPLYTVREDEYAVNITVLRLAPVATDVLVNYSGWSNSSDYSIPLSALTFAPNVTEQNITVYITDNKLEEHNVDIMLRLEAATGGASVGSPDTAVVTIIDDDRRPGKFRISPDSISVTYNETDENGTITVNVERFDGAFGSALISLLPVNDTAVAPFDYVGEPVPVYFAHGMTMGSGKVTIIGDQVPEQDEKFEVKIEILNSQYGAQLGTETEACVTIVDDDRVTGIVEFQTSSMAFSESSGNVSIVISRQGNIFGEVELAVSTTDISTTKGIDYMVRTTLDMEAGEPTQLLPLRIFDDQEEERDEIFWLHIMILTSDYGIKVGKKSTVTISIVDNDRQNGTLQLASSSYTVFETAGTVDVIINRGNGSIGTAQVEVSFDDGSAVSTRDFDGKSKTVAFADNQTSANLQIGIIDNKVGDGPKSFTLKLHTVSGEYNVVLGEPSVANVTILDDESHYGKLQLSEDDYEVKENVGYVNIEVRRTLGTKGLVSVMIMTFNGSASSPKDYQHVRRVLLFSEGDILKKVSIPIVDNKVDDLSRYFTVELSNATGGASLGKLVSTTVTIEDNDPAARENGDIYGFEIRIINREFNEAFKNRSSTAYKQLEKEVKQQIKPELEDATGFENLYLKGVRQGSFILVMAALIDKRLDDGSFSTTLKTTIMSGQAGTFLFDTTFPSTAVKIKAGGAVTVETNCQGGNFLDTTSFSCKPCPINTYQPLMAKNVCFKCPRGWSTKTEGSTSASQCKEADRLANDLPYIVGGSVGGLLFLLLLVIFILFYLHSRKPHNNIPASTYLMDPYPYTVMCTPHWPRYRDQFPWLNWIYGGLPYGSRMTSRYIDYPYARNLSSSKLNDDWNYNFKWIENE